MISMTGNRLFTRFALIFNFLIPAFLLNCVAIVIMKLINTHAGSISQTSWLEAFKDGFIIVGSLVLGTFVPRIGYKRSILISILIEIVASFVMLVSPGIMGARIFFSAAGFSFGVLKVGIYSSVALVTDDESSHAGFLSFLEGCFTTAILGGFWFFSFFVEQTHWERIYYYFIAAGIIGFFLILISDLNEKSVEKSLAHDDKGSDSNGAVAAWGSFQQIFLLLGKLTVWIFLFIAFFYVFVEQGLTTWLPTYNNHVINIAAAQSVRLASLLAAAIAIGRLVSAVILKYVNWRIFLSVSMIIGAVLFLAVLSLSAVTARSTTPITHWSDFPFVAYLIPLIGLFIGPIYPVFCSSILSGQEKSHQSAMTTLIIVFSALGGSIGSRFVGYSFNLFGGLTAFKVPLPALILILVLSFPYYILLNRSKKARG